MFKSDAQGKRGGGRFPISKGFTLLSASRGGERQRDTVGEVMKGKGLPPKGQDSPQLLGEGRGSSVGFLIQKKGKRKEERGKFQCGLLIWDLEKWGSS